MQDVRKKLNIKIESPFWDEALKKAQNDPEVPEWLTQEYVSALEERFSILKENLLSVLAALEQVVKTPELCLFAKILYHIIEKKESFSNSFPVFELPEAPEGASEVLGYDCVGLFPILAHVIPFSRELEARSVPEDVISDTLSFLRSFVSESFKKTGKPCFDKSSFSVFRVFVYTNYLWIGRLRFEIEPDSKRKVRGFINKCGEIRSLACDVTLHRSGNFLGAIGFTDEEGSFEADFVETDDFYEGYAVNPESSLVETARTRLPKSEWECIFKPGDALLKIHIPNGGPLTKEVCDLSYERAREIFRKSYPEYDFKAFVCCTWFLCPLLQGFLKPDSNIVSFQKRHRLFPGKNTAADVFLYVFNKTVSSADEVDFKSLPEDNSMMRGVKKLLLDGKYVHQVQGYIPF